MLAALIDLAAEMGEEKRVNVETVSEALLTLDLPEWELQVEPRYKQGIRGLGLNVITPWGTEVVEDLEHVHQGHSHTGHHDNAQHQVGDRQPLTDQPSHHPHGLSLAEILARIEGSSLNTHVKERSREVFDLLGQAEGRAHGVDPLEVHFHEVGMVDSLVDIIGSAWCLDVLGIEHILSAPPPLNRGWVRCAHGLIPLPAPATSFILKGIETIQSPHQVELVTPTGAAMLRAWSHLVTTHWPTLPTRAIGWGAGKRDLSDRPNLLRLILCEPEANVHAHPDLPPAECWLIEANIDDQSPEAIATARDLLLSSGALDAWLTAIVMKEGRSATKMSVLCVAERVDELECLLLTHTAAIGCRRSRWERTVLPRRFVQVDTPWGGCQVKVTQVPGSMTPADWRLKVEHRQARALAHKHKITLAEVERTVLNQARRGLQSGRITWDQLMSEQHLPATRYSSNHRSPPLGDGTNLSIMRSDQREETS